MKRHITTSLKRRTTAWTRRRRITVMGFCIVFLAAGAGGGVMLLNHPNKAANTADVLTARISGPLKEGDLLAGQWAYMPGASRQKNGLHIAAVPFTIVTQDGSRTQNNPPVNLAGTHLEAASDFTITASLTDIDGPIGITLYGQVPVIADEFRVERKSLSVYINDNSVILSLWDGSQQPPIKTIRATLPASIQKNTEVEITRSGGTMQLRVDKSAPVNISDNGAFNDGSVWFGFDTEKGGFTIAGLRVVAAENKTLKIADGSNIQPLSSDLNGLQILAIKKRPGFLVGAAMALGPLTTDSQYAQIALGGNFGVLTPENAMKWQFIEPSRGMFNFTEGDALVHIARQHGLKLQGHTLVFGEANPSWVRQLPVSELEKAMNDHIAAVVGHYKGNVYSWDVVNEPFDDDEWDTLRPHIWYKAMGESYITKAFTAARAADPNALLFINEYGLEEDGDRWDNFLALVTRLKKQGVPIDGVGFQTHVYERGDKINPNVLQKHIKQLAAIGVKARISEMDVYSEDGPGAQARQYADVFKMCLNEPNCISWATWGVSDRYDYFKDDDGSIQTGEDFLWDNNMRPTPAVDRIRQLLR